MGPIGSRIAVLVCIAVAYWLGRSDGSSGVPIVLMSLLVLSFAIWSFAGMRRSQGREADIGHKDLLTGRLFRQRFLPEIRRLLRDYPIDAAGDPQKVLELDLQFFMWSREEHQFYDSELEDHHWKLLETLRLFLSGIAQQAGLTPNQTRMVSVDGDKGDVAGRVSTHKDQLLLDIEEFETLLRRKAPREFS